MAEQNVPNDGVDKLSEKSEFIGPAQIGANLYKPFTQPAFDVRSVNSNIEVSNPALRIKDTTKGSAPYHPKKVDSPNSKGYGTIDGMMSELRGQLAKNVDKNAYNKIYAYDASSKGAHKARYKAYGQETYDKLGFSPEIDNETWFNANTTLYDDWKRMALHSAWPMMKLGFMSPIKSYGKLFGQADIGQDLAEAADYEEYNAIGYSTKGGIGGFLINLQNSAAYSVGIIAESVIEGALIGAAVGAVGGEGVGAAPGAVVGGAIEGATALFKLPSTLINMSKSIGKMAMNLKKLESLSAIKSTFTGAGTSMGKFINPFTNTTEAAMQYVFKNPDDLTNLARTARTAGAMWHDVKNINAALSEGRLEGGFTEQRVYDELYNKYYEKHGVAPTDELQKSMRQQAKIAGFQNTWKNTLLVNYSNRIAFPSITKAKFIKSLPKFSKTMGNVGPYQIIYDPSKKVAEDLYRYEKISLKNAAKGLIKPSTYGKTAFNYFKANLVEGLQETTQEVLADATENYYVNSFQNKDRQNFEYSMATLNAAMKKQISAQGMETFASGFLMGSILGIPGGVKDYLSVGYNKYYKHRDNYDEYIKEREGSVKEIVDSLNTMDQNAKYFFDPRMNNYVNQMLVGRVADAPEEGSAKESKDASFSGFYSSVMTSLRSGTFDMFLENFQGYKQASPEDIEDAWRLEPGQGAKALEFIDAAIGNAKEIAGRWQYAKNKYKHVIDPSNFAENTPEKEMADIYNNAYLTALDNLVFMGASFDNNTERLGQMYSKLSSLPTIRNSRFSDFASIVDPDRLQKEISMLRTEVELGGTAAVTPEAKEQYKNQKDLLEKLENYQREQAVATVEFVKQVAIAQKEIMDSEPDISRNEAREKALDKVVNDYDKQNLNVFDNYKDSYLELLGTLAGSEENKVKLNREIDEAGGIDTMFDMLMDSFLLRNENLSLNRHINVLNDPKGFYDHVQKNFEWMSKLYKNRQTYYEDVVKNSIEAIQRNTLLEELAENGIFVDLEEFAEWINDKTKLPTYFVDQVNKRIINEDSYLYDKYISLFEQATDAEVANPIIPKKEVDEKLQRTIDNYNNQREGELESVQNVYDRSLKELIGYTQNEIETMRNQALAQNNIDPEKAEEQIKLIEKALKQLDSNNPLEVQAVLELAQEEGFVDIQEFNNAKEAIFTDEALYDEVVKAAEKYKGFEEEDALDAAGNSVVLKPILEKKLELLKTPQEEQPMDGIPEYENTKPYQDYVKAVDTINEKYDTLIEEAIQESEEIKQQDVEAKRSSEMKQAIKAVQDVFAGKEDIVQTKRNYIVDGELHERMSNVIKTGYDTYGYSGETALMDIYDRTIGAALEGTTTPTPGTAYQEADIERRRQEELDKADLFHGTSTPKNALKGEFDVNESFNVAGQTQGAGLYVTPLKSRAEIYKQSSQEQRKLKNQSVGKPTILSFNKKDFNLYNSADKIGKTFYEKVKTKYPSLAITENTTFSELYRAIFKQETGVNFSPTILSDFMIEIMVELGIDGINYGEKTTLGREESVIYNFEKIKNNEINAKYDAELDTLEEDATPVQGTLTQDLIDEFIDELVDANLPGVNTNDYTVDIVRDELETLIAPDETKLTKKTQRNISKLKDQLLDVENKLVSTKDKARKESLEKQKTQLEQAIKDEETGKFKEKFELTNDNIKSFILNTVKENAYEESRDAGNIIDPMLKDYFDTATSKKPAFDSSKMSREAYDALFDDETGYLTQIKKLADAGDIYVFTKNLIVHDNNLVDDKGNKLPPVAGEIDMIIVDKLGRTFIVDLKTGKKSKWENYKTLNTPSYKKQLENTLQQTGYANLLENMGLKVDGIMIMPLEIGFNDKGKIVRAGEPINPSLFAGEEILGDDDSVPFTIKLDKTNSIQVKKEDSNLYETLPIEEFMQRIVPVRKGGKPKAVVKGKQAPTVTIPEEERNFVNEFMYRISTAGQNVSTKVEPVTKESEEIKEAKKITLNDVVGKTVYLNGKPYIVEKEGFKYILNSSTTIIELAANKDSTLDELGIDYYQGEYYKPEYDITINDENSVTVDGVTYTIQTNNLGNVTGLSPENKPRQVIRNNRMIIAVEIERNKFDFVNEIDELENVDYNEAMEEVSKTDPKAHEKLAVLEGVYTKNWNSTVESGLSKLYSKEELTDSEKLAVDLWVTNAIIDLSKIYTRLSDPIYAKGLDNLEIINTLLYEGYDQFTENVAETSVAKPAKTKVKQAQKQTKRKAAKIVPESIVEEPFLEEEDVEVDKDLLSEDNTYEDLVELYKTLEENKPSLSQESYNMLKDELDRKLFSLFDDTGKIVLKTGEIYIFTEPVAELKIPVGYSVKIIKANPRKGTVEIARTGPGRPKTVTMNISDFVSKTISEDMLNNIPKEEEPYIPSPDEIKHIMNSMVVTDEQLGDFEQLMKWENEASSADVSLDELKNNFFDNIKC